MVELNLKTDFSLKSMPLIFHRLANKVVFLKPPPPLFSKPKSTKKSFRRCTNNIFTHVYNYISFYCFMCWQHCKLGSFLIPTLTPPPPSYYNPFLISLRHPKPLTKTHNYSLVGLLSHFTIAFLSSSLLQSFKVATENG